MSDLDPILHQPIRTKIVALLASTGECDYTTIKNYFKLSDGHMSTHMRVLTNNNYIEVRKFFINNKPKTTYQLTRLGRDKLQVYVDQLKELILKETT